MPINILTRKGNRLYCRGLFRFYHFDGYIHTNTLAPTQIQLPIPQKVGQSTRASNGRRDIRITRQKDGALIESIGTDFTTTYFVYFAELD